MAFSYAKFDRYAPQMIADLMHDFGLKDFQAAAFPGQTAAESRYMTDIIEDGAIAKGMAGGTGWLQDTGPRRRAAEAYWKRRNYFGLGSLAAAADSYIGNYSYLFLELSGPKKAALGALRTTTTPEQAAQVVCRRFERPADPAASMALRVRGTKRALDLYRQNPPQPTVWPTDHPATTQEPAMPTVIATPSHAAIPWWRSVVAVASGSGLGASLYAIVQAYRPGVPLLQQLDTLAPPILAAGATGAALLARVGSHAQPLTMSQGKADEITAQRVAAAETMAPTPEPVQSGQPVNEAWAPQPVSPMASIMLNLITTAMGVPKPVRDALGQAIPNALAIVDALKQGEHHAAQEAQLPNVAEGPMPSRFNGT